MSRQQEEADDALKERINELIQEIPDDAPVDFYRIKLALERYAIAIRVLCLIDIQEALYNKKDSL